MEASKVKGDNVKFVVETGDGCPDATSYVDIMDADAFHARMQSEWLGDIASRKQALAIASAYLDESYAWKGTPKEANQALAWPRLDSEYGNRRRPLPTGVPPEIRRACVLLAAVWLKQYRQAAAGDSGQQPGSVSLSCVLTSGEQRRLHKIVQRLTVSPQAAEGWLAPFGQTLSGKTVRNTDGWLNLQ